MRNATKNFLIVLFLMFSFTVLSSTTLAFSEVRTVVTIISPPEINDLSISQDDDGIVCTWSVSNAEKDVQYFSNVIWLKGNDFFREEQLTCVNCSSKIQPENSNGVWKCIVTVRDTNNLETTRNASLSIVPSGPAGFFLLNSNSIFDVFTDVGKFIYDVGGKIQKLLDIFS